MHNNYMILMQTFINQKGLKAPGEKENVLEVLVSPAAIVPYYKLNRE